MLWTGLIRIDREKVASVEYEISSVTLRHVTPIMVVRCRRLIAESHIAYRAYTGPMPCPCRSPTMPCR